MGAPAAVLEDFRAVAQARRLILPSHIVADGRVHRVPVRDHDDKTDGAYCLHVDGVPFGWVQNWTDGFERQNWNGNPDHELTPAEEKSIKNNLDAQRAQYDAECEKRWAAAQQKAYEIWNASTECENHPYLSHKGIQGYGIGVGADGRLVIPVMDAEGELHTVQFIDPDGTKMFLSGGRVHGHFLTLGEPGPIIYITEGFATAASVQEATEACVVAAFNCDNLLPVGQALREKYPAAKLIFCADDDYQTDGNPGRTKATKAAKTVNGCVVLPDFGPNRPKGGTDFNDMHQAKGLEAVRVCIEKSESTTDEALPSIVVVPPEDVVVEKALAALAKRGRLFQRGHLLTHVAVQPPSGSQQEPPGPSILLATAPWTRLELSQSAAFFKPTQDGLRRILVPDFVPLLALEMSNHPGIPELFAVAETPLFLADGTIFCTPGLDPKSGIYFTSLGELPCIKENPTLEDAKTAAAALFEPVQDFSFAAEAHRAAWLALLLTLAARFAIPGPVPFWLIDANGMAAGKGLLTRISSIITLGRDPVSMVASMDPEEFRKTALCVLMAGSRLAWLDEAPSPFGDRRWCGLITATTYSDRVLGASRTWTGPHFTIWIVSGNNVGLTSDAPRRCVHIRLEPPQERPETRTGFKIPDLVAHVKRHRAELLGNVLTILAAYHAAGRPRQGLTAWGSFEEWSRLVRDAVFWVTGQDCDSRAELSASADSTREAMAVILESLEILFPGQKPFPTADVLAAYFAPSADHRGVWQYPELRNALDALNGSGKELNPRIVGNLLKARKDRTFGGRQLKNGPEARPGMTWRILRIGEALGDACGSVGSSGSVSPRPGKKPERRQPCTKY